MVLFCFVACQNKTLNVEDDRIKIVCTTGILGDVVQNIVDSNFQVDALMGAGVDPHLYKASQGDLMLLSQADIIIYNGNHLEGKMGEVLKKLERQKTIVAATEMINSDLLINNSDFNATYDPHLWFDVSLWASVTGKISEVLSKSFPMHEIKIQQATSEYLAELAALHNWTQSQIQSINQNKRVLITAHDAFSYFGRAYQIEVKGLQGISTVSEYGLKDISNMVDFITEKKIKSVFVESSVSDRALNAVIEGCESKNHILKIGGTLYSDAMGEANTEEGTYIGMIKHNVETIVNGLQ